MKNSSTSFYFHRKSLNLADSIDFVWKIIEEVNDKGNVVKIDFFLDETVDYGVFDEEWDQLASHVYTSFDIIGSSEENCSQAKDRFCTALFKLKSTVFKVQEFIKEVRNGKVDSV